MYSVRHIHLIFYNFNTSIGIIFFCAVWLFVVPHIQIWRRLWLCVNYHFLPNYTLRTLCSHNVHIIEDTSCIFRSISGDAMQNNHWLPFSTSQWYSDNLINNPLCFFVVVITVRAYNWCGWPKAWIEWGYFSDMRIELQSPWGEGMHPIALRCNFIL